MKKKTYRLMLSSNILINRTYTRFPDSAFFLNVNQRRRSESTEIMIGFKMNT